MQNKKPFEIDAVKETNVYGYSFIPYEYMKKVNKYIEFYFYNMLFELISGKDSSLHMHILDESIDMSTYDFSNDTRWSTYSKIKDLKNHTNRLEEYCKSLGEMYNDSKDIFTWKGTVYLQRTPEREHNPYRCLVRQDKLDRRNAYEITEVNWNGREPTDKKGIELARSILVQFEFWNKRVNEIYNELEIDSYEVMANDFSPRACIFNRHAIYGFNAYDIESLDFILSDVGRTYHVNDRESDFCFRHIKNLSYSGYKRDAFVIFDNINQVAYIFTKSGYRNKELLEKHLRSLHVTLAEYQVSKDAIDAVVERVKTVLKEFNKETT